MSARVDPFAMLKVAPVFETKPKKEKPVAQDAIEQIAKDNNFHSRPISKPVAKPKRRPRYYTTGRNQQLNLKATSATIERFNKRCEERKVPQGLLLELALDALDREDARQAIDSR